MFDPQLDSYAARADARLCASSAQVRFPLLGQAGWGAQNPVQGADGRRCEAKRPLSRLQVIVSQGLWSGRVGSQPFAHAGSPLKTDLGSPLGAHPTLVPTLAPHF